MRTTTCLSWLLLASTLACKDEMAANVGFVVADVDEEDEDDLM